MENATSTGTEAQEEIPQPEATDPGRVESVVTEAGPGDARQDAPPDYPEEAGGFEIVERFGGEPEFYYDGSGGNHPEPPEAENEEAKVAPKKKRAPRKKASRKKG